MGMTTNRKTQSGKLTLFLAVLAILISIACHPGPDEDQDQKQDPYRKIAALFELERLERLGELPEDKKELLAELRRRGMVPKNKEEFEWFLKAAGRGDDPFSELKKKRKLELDQLRKTAEQGDEKAQFELGRMYASGEGVPEDYVQAYAWLNLATAQGRSNASKAKELLRSSMTAEQVAEAQRLAAELFKRIEALKSK